MKYKVGDILVINNNYVINPSMVGVVVEITRSYPSRAFYRAEVLPGQNAQFNWDVFYENQLTFNGLVAAIRMAKGE
jgi:hypothetical protein